MAKSKQNPLRENPLERQACEGDVGFGNSNVKTFVQGRSLSGPLQNNLAKYSSEQNPGYHPFAEWTDYPYKFP